MRPRSATTSSDASASSRRTSACRLIALAELGLDDFECEVLVLCAAAELDTDVARVLAYIHDDATRTHVSVELACGLTARDTRDRMARRLALAPEGKLARLGLIERAGGAADPIKLRPEALRALLGGAIDLHATFRDPAEVELVAPAAIPADGELVARVARELATRELEVVAIWGDPRRTHDVVAAIAQGARLSVRRFPSPNVEPASAVATAAALRTALWVDLDAIEGRPSSALIDALRTTSVPVVLTGANAWRPTELLTDRSYIEIPLCPLDTSARRSLWETELPELTAAQWAELAGTYHFSPSEIHAAATIARTMAKLRSNGHAVLVEQCVVEACAAVARKEGERHTTLVTPRRSLDELVLANDIHQRVLDVVRYHRAAPKVIEEWGFGRRVASVGIKALFTGEPGTGKTMAAEVVAFELGLSLLKVDLARVVSKWVGETEKNLDVAFREALDSHAVLFFDEAEALFGNRGEVRHGSDRYANLEVSYLLQRLESHPGVVVLATNLRDKIDPAFMRRFHVVVGFTRPAERERRRMWQRVFPPDVPMIGDLDIALLARLDLTGAGIVGAAQTAAYLAASEGASVAMSHVVGGLVRQYQREARVLSANDLGAHASHMRVQ